MVLAKEKNDAQAMDYFIRSVHKYPMNWGCWLEMTSIISRVEEVSLTKSANFPFLYLTIKLTIQPLAKPNSTTLPPKHRILHVPPPHISRTIPTNPQSRQLPRATPLNIPHVIIPPHLQRPPGLPRQRPHGRRTTLQPPPLPTPAQTRLPRPLLQHPLRPQHATQARLRSPPLFQRRQVPPRIMRRHRQLLLPPVHARKSSSVL